MKRLLLLICLFPILTYAQKIPPTGFDKVRIVTEESIVQADILPVSNDPEILSDRFYYWYSSNVIHTTQGGFSGRLLNGNYSAYYLNKNLKQKGVFVQGLKDGEWKDWNENGALTQMYTWKKGIRSGKYYLCDEKGFITQSGKFKNDRLVVKDSISLWRKIDIFKKKKN